MDVKVTAAQGVKAVTCLAVGTTWVASKPGGLNTYCMNDDVIAAKPVFEQKAFNLYLVDSRNHCLCFTRDMEVATGVVLAEIEDDE